MYIIGKIVKINKNRMTYIPGNSKWSLRSEHLFVFACWGDMAFEGRLMISEL